MNIQNIRPMTAVTTVLMITLFSIILFWVLLDDSFKINESTDYLRFYEPVGRNIAQGHGIYLHGSAAIQYPPGYPVTLAGLFLLAQFLNVSETIILSGFILICMGLSSIFLFLIAKRISNLFLAMLTAAAWITYPFTLWLTKQPNSEIPFFVAFYGGFLLLWLTLIRESPSLYRYFLCGLVFGIGMLIRPVGIGLAFVSGAIIFLLKRDLTLTLRFGCAGMVLLGNLTCIVPWEIWVYSKTGKWILLSRGDAPSVVDGLTFALPDRTSRKLVPVPEDVKLLMNTIHLQRGEMRSASKIVSIMVEQLRKKPLAMAKLFAIKALRSWYGTDSRRFESEIILVQIPYFSLILLATWKCWRAGGKYRELVISSWIVLFYFWMITTLVNSQLRYMTPAIGLTFVFLPGLITGARTLNLAPSLSRERPIENISL